MSEHTEPRATRRGRIESVKALEFPRVIFIDNIVDLLVKEAMRALSESSRNGGLNYAVELLSDAQKYCSIYCHGRIPPDPFSDSLAEKLRNWNTPNDGNR